MALTEINQRVLNAGIPGVTGVIEILLGKVVGAVTVVLCTLVIEKEDSKRRSHE